MSNTVLVTGGAGFIGSNFVRLALSETDSRLVVLDKLTYAGHLENLAGALDDPRVTFVRGDIVDRELVRSLYRDHHPDWILNFAAESHVDRSIDGPREFLNTNVTGTFELLESARLYLAERSAAEKNRFRLLHVSTDEVFGSLGADGLFTETTPYAPNSPYSASKAAADHFVRAYHETYGLPVLVTNCSNNYGPYQYPEKLIPLVMLNAVEGKPLPIYGDGLNVRDWLHVEDHCRALLCVLRNGEPGASFNIGARNEKTNVEVVDGICGALERIHPAADNPNVGGRGIRGYAALKTFVRDRPGHDRRYAIDPTRIEAQLGWRPRYDFAQGLEQTVRWYLDHRDWCRAVQAGTYQRERLGLSEATTQPS